MYNNSFYLFYTQHPCPPIDNRDIWGCIWLQRMGSILCSFISLSVDYGIRNNPYLQHSLWPCRKEQNQLQRSICRTEQGIKWTNHHEKGEIRTLQEDCGKRVSVAEGVSFSGFCGVLSDGYGVMTSFFRDWSLDDGAAIAESGWVCVCERFQWLWVMMNCPFFGVEWLGSWIGRMGI